MKGRGLRTRTVLQEGTKNKKEKNKQQTEETEERNNRDRCIVLDYTHLQNEDRQELEKTANLGWKSLLFSPFFSGAVTDCQMALRS